MRAITYRALGPAADVLTLDDLPKPTPRAGEVLVRVHYSGVNPSDVKLRAGNRPGVTAPPFPVMIPHSDGAGVIDAVGPGVPAHRVGERVWLWNACWQRAQGTAADYVALPQAQAVPLPDDIPLQTGAVLGIPGLTAAHCVFADGEVRGKTLLISGGSGTVGILAVQLAKWGGARVIATCSPAMAQRVRDAGADTVLDYAAPDLPAQILAANQGQPIARAIEVEAGRNIDMLTQVIAVGGTIAAYGSAQLPTFELPFYPLMFRHVTLRMVLIYLLPLRERLQAVMHLHAALTEGALDIDIAQIHPAADCALAHAAVEAGHRQGAVLIDFT